MCHLSHIFVKYFALIIIFAIIYKQCLLVAQNKIEMASNNIQIVITINEEELLHACSEWSVSYRFLIMHMPENRYLLDKGDRDCEPMHVWYDFF
jgi:hypothetical protein